MRWSALTVLIVLGALFGVRFQLGASSAPSRSPTMTATPGHALTVTPSPSKATAPDPGTAQPRQVNEPVTVTEPPGRAIIANPSPQSPPADAFLGWEAVLDLGEPRECIPETGLPACDSLRAALWQGDATAWRVRGITDPAARFNETVLFRVRAGDPVAIRNIALLMGAPYVKITRVRFLVDEVTVTNLGGGSQDMTGWSLRSPSRTQFNGVFPFPAGTTLEPGRSCTLYTGPERNLPDGVCAWRTYSVRPLPPGGWWPDEGGEVVLFSDALDLLGDRALYGADPAHQPPPPHLRLVRSAP